MHSQLPEPNVPQSIIRRALAVFFVGFVVLGCFFLAFKRTDLFPWVGDCAPNDQENTIVAYCHSVRFGDYEHYAYFHESEPLAIKHVKSADVVFLGSSNTQFAFSTDAVNDYFNDIDQRHYVLGFGHGSQSGVAKAVAKKLNLSPNVWVVNADPFFTGLKNATFSKIETNANPTDSWRYLPLRFRPTVAGEYERKRLLFLEQSKRCGKSGDLGESGNFRNSGNAGNAGNAGNSNDSDNSDNSDNSGESSLWCSGREDTLHRNLINGHWLVEHYRENQEIPVGENSSDHLGQLAQYSNVAEEFIQDLNIDRKCLVITATPRTDTPKEFAEALANQLDVEFVFPSLNNLTTIDGFHLTPNSAEEWSQALLNQLSQTIQRCAKFDSQRAD